MPRTLRIRSVRWVKNAVRDYPHGLVFGERVNIVVGGNGAGKSSLRRALHDLFWEPSKEKSETGCEARLSLDGGAEFDGRRLAGKSSLDEKIHVEGGDDYVFDLREMIGGDKRSHSIAEEMKAALLGGYARERALTGFDVKSKPKVPTKERDAWRAKVKEENDRDRRERDELASAQAKWQDERAIRRGMDAARGALARRGIERDLEAARRALEPYADFRPGLRQDDGETLAQARRSLETARREIQRIEGEIRLLGLAGKAPDDADLNEIRRLLALLRQKEHALADAEKRRANAVAFLETQRAIRRRLDGEDAAEPAAFEAFVKLFREHATARERAIAREEVERELPFPADPFDKRSNDYDLSKREEWFRAVADEVLALRAYAQAATKETQELRRLNDGGEARKQGPILLALILILVAALLAAILAATGMATPAAVSGTIAALAAGVAAYLVFSAGTAGPRIEVPPAPAPPAASDLKEREDIRPAIDDLRDLLRAEAEDETEHTFSVLRTRLAHQRIEQERQADALHREGARLTRRELDPFAVDEIRAVSEKLHQAECDLAAALVEEARERESCRQARASFDARLPKVFSEDDRRSDEQKLDALGDLRKLQDQLAAQRVKEQDRSDEIAKIKERTGLDDERLLQEQCAKFDDWGVAKDRERRLVLDLQNAKPDVEGSDAELEDRIARAEAQIEDQNELSGKIGELKGKIAAREEADGTTELARAYRSAQEKFVEARLKRLDGEIAEAILNDLERGLVAAENEASTIADDLARRVMGFRIEGDGSGVRIKNAQNEPRDLGGLSDGERVQIATIFRLAALKAKEHGDVAPLLLDETTGNSDAERQANLARTVLEFAREPERQIFVFTNRRSDAAAWHEAAKALEIPCHETDLEAAWHNRPFTDEREEDPSLKAPEPGDPFECPPLDPYSDAIPLALLFDEADREMLSRLRAARLDRWHQVEPELRNEPRYEEWARRAEFLRAAREAFRIGRPRAEVTAALVAGFSNWRRDTAEELLARHSSLTRSPIALLEAVERDPNYKTQIAKKGSLRTGFEAQGWTSEGRMNRDEIFAEATRLAGADLDFETRARLVDLLFRAPEEET